MTDEEVTVPVILNNADAIYEFFYQNYSFELTYNKYITAYYLMP